MKVGHMSIWKELDRKARQEKRAQEDREREEQSLARTEELERISSSSIEDIDIIILEFLNAAAVKRFPRKVFRNNWIERDPLWRTPTSDHPVYTAEVHGGIRYTIYRTGDWYCEHPFYTGGEWGHSIETVYGKRSGEYFMEMTMKYSPPSPGDIDPLRRALIDIMNEFKIPLPD
jgi:hypothetical protein